jgi:DNA-binding XRE family transcriptional regulator
MRDNPRSNADPPNRIAEFRKKRGLTQGELGKKVGAHWITISKLEHGKMKLTYDWLDKLAVYLRAEPEELVARPRSLVVHSDGRLLRGRIVELLGARGPAFQVDRRCFSEELVWVEVVGSDLAPFFSDGDLIRAAATEEPDEAYLGRLCILFLREQGHVLGVPSTGASEGHYNVRCLTGPDFENVEIELFLPVLATFYRSASTGKVFGSEADIAMSD